MILSFAPPYRYGGHTHCNLLQHLITRPCAGPARCRRVRTETCAMSLWRRLLARPAKPQPMLPLYGAVVEYARARSEEHTSELQSLMRISFAVFCLQKKKPKLNISQL